MYKEAYGNIPNKDKIVSYLEEGYAQNPGDWILHLWVIGQTAAKIAKEIGLDPDIAFACGALHDLGKSTGAKGAEHFYQSYKILRADSYFFPARIALTHSFQLKNVDSYVGHWNIGEANKEFVRNFIEKIEYNDYDLLIQVLDGLIKTEYLGIEKRAAGVLKNHGANPYFEKRKEKLYELEEYFQNKLSKPISAYLPKARWHKFPYNKFRK